MDLFGAATMGVDPKTGSYLSKEQRVAMFRASRGIGGGAGGGSVPPGSGGGARVTPQNAIVPVKRNQVAAVQKLQKTYESTAESVAQQVEKNRQNIAKLYTLVLTGKEEQLKQEKKRVEVVQKRKSNLLRAAKERAVEAAANMASGAAMAVQKTAEKAFKPVEGLFKKLLKFFGLVAGAWVIDNLPTILTALDKFVNNLPNLTNAFDLSLSDLRGVWSNIDLVLKGIRKAFGGVLDKAGEIGKWVLRKGASLVKKIFKPIINFVIDVIDKGIDAVRRFVTGARTPKPTPNPRSRGRGAGSTRPALPDGQAKLTGSSGKGKLNWKNIWGSTKKGISNLATGAQNTIQRGMEGLNKMGSSIRESLSSIMPKGEAKPLNGSQKGFLRNILEGVAEKANVPKPLMTVFKKGFGMLDQLFRRIPFVGFAIDYMLNAKEGMQFQENITRSLASSLAGMGGAAAGAKIGGGIGFAAGSVVPVLGNAVGAAIGAALGAIIGGMIGGTAGDAVGAAAYSTYTGKTTTDTGLIGGAGFDNFIKDVPGNTQSLVEAATKGDSSRKMAPNFKVMASGNSTPEGLEMKQGALGAAMQVIDLPPMVTDMRNQTPQKEDVAPPAQKSFNVPAFTTSDSAMDSYRMFASAQYQLREKE